MTATRPRPSRSWPTSWSGGGSASCRYSPPQGRLAGVVAEGDLLRKEQLQRDPDGRHSMHLPYRTRRDIATAETAGELMDRYPATVPAGTSVAEAARLMDRHQTRFLLVTGEDGKLLGVVTARDLLRVFLRPDAAIKAEISQDVLSRYLGTNLARVKVHVTDGVVRLTASSSATIGLWLTLAPAIGAIARTGTSGKKN